MSRVRLEVATLVRLAAPVVATQLGSMMLWVVDFVMVGAVGVEPFDTVSLGRLWIMGTITFGMGVVFGIDPIVTQAHGARDEDLLGLTLQRGAVVALLVGLPIGVSWLFTTDVLVAFGQDAHLSALAREYVLVQLPLIPLFLGFTVLRQFLLGRGIVYPTLWVTLLANVVNVIANWVLIFGHLGFPALGAVGAGIATTVTSGFMLAALWIWTAAAGLHRGAWRGLRREALELRGLGGIVRLGLPVGVQIGLEMWAFMAATLFAGKLGAEELAAHTIAINLASISFMVPLGISFGSVTRVGNLIGEGDRRRAQVAAWVALTLGAGVMVVSALVFVVFRYRLPALYTADPGVIALTAAILPIAAAFQLFDGTQVVGGGILRGMGRTRPAAVFNLVGYYGLALPLGYWLTFGLGFGLRGIWWGLCLGLATVALLLVVWVWRRGPARAAALVR